jgi:hypothetical protein
MSKQTVGAMLLLLVAVSSNAYAGATISDKRYWPSEARQGAYRPSVPQGGWSSAFASAPRTPGFFLRLPAPEASSRVWRYQGGPKSPMTRN